MNLFLMTLWFLSGAVFPVTGTPGWLKALMLINPLTYGVAALQKILYPSFLNRDHLPSAGVCLLITVVFAVLMMIFSLGIVKKVERSA